jgi:beta-lactamase regulating signal transducer with metallopeptidase domain
MLWQSSLLIAVLFIIDIGFRRKLRPALRYALWMVLLVKLLLPPSLALPTAVAWWLRPAAVAPTLKPHTSTFAVTYGPAVLPEPSTKLPAMQPPPPPPLPLSVWALLASGLVSVALLIWMLFRWAVVANTARGATEAPSWLIELVTQTRKAAGFRRPVRVRLTATPMSPAVCGFLRPVVLLPHTLTNLPQGRLRAVLLHELIHLRRGDVWLNCAQALLQIVYWWHPLLWLANVRICRLREEAVDDAVMLALREDAADYAPTLLEVARLALQRPLTSLGLVGILESKTALRRRIERLVDFRAPRKAGLTFASVLGLGLFTAMAVPMGEAPAFPQRSGDISNAQTSPWPDPRFEGYADVQLDPHFYLVDGTSLRAVLPTLLNSEAPLVLSSNEVADLGTTLRQANAQPACPSRPLSFAKFSGGRFLWHVGGTTNMTINYHAKEVGGRTIVTGANVEVAASLQEWIPLALNVAPWTDGTQLRCELELAWSEKDSASQQATAVLPPHGALLWAKPIVGFSGKYEMVILRRDTAKPESQQPSIATASPSTSQSGPVASTTNQSSTVQLDNLLKAQTKVQNGKLLFEMGKLDEAETSLSQALILNQQSEAAQYYLKLVQEARRKKPEQMANSSSNPTRQTGTNQSAGRRALLSKLNRIRVDEISFENVPLREVVEELARRSRALDPEKRGINFIIKNDVYPPQAADTGVPGVVPIDPATGLPVPQPPLTDQNDIGEVSIRILPALKNVTLEEALDAIVKVAEKPVKYAIEDSAIVFSSRRFEPAPLYTRLIKVDPNTFEQGLRDVNSFDWGTSARPTRQGGAILAPTRTSDPVQMMVSQFFLTVGLDLAPPKSIYYNSREGKLFVRTSLQELDVIEQAVRVLNVTPPQINIKTKFIAVPSDVMSELQGKVLLKPDPVPSQGDMILTAPQAHVLLKAFESNSNVDLVSEASVTTLSGRQTQISVESEPPGLSQTNTPSFPGFGNVEPRLTNMPPAVQLDIIAFARADDSKVQISGTATVTEFLGFNSPGSVTPTNPDSEVLNDQVQSGQSKSSLPHFRVRQLPFASTLWDGQTLLLGGLLSNAEKSNSLPGQSQKSLLVLITPTLIDPAGNRIHKEDEPPK